MAGPRLSRDGRPLTGMTVSWGNLGLHLMSQPSLLPGEPHIAEWDVSETSGRQNGTFRMCPECGTMLPVIECRCGRIEVLTFSLLGVDPPEDGTVPAFIPVSHHSTCSVCAGESEPETDSTRCSVCDTPLDSR